MKQSIYEILENVEIAKNTMKMVLAGDTSDCTAPGQFKKQAGRLLPEKTDFRV